MLHSTPGASISYSLLDPSVKRVLHPVSITFGAGVSFDNTAWGEHCRSSNDDADTQNHDRQPTFPQDQTPCTPPSLFHLLTHHTNGTLRHAAVRTLGDFIVPLLLTHCSSTLTSLDLRNTDRLFTEVVGLNSIIYGGNRNVLTVIDLSSSDYDPHATRSDWEALGKAASLPSSEAGGDPGPPALALPAAPTTPITQMGYLLQSNLATISSTTTTCGHGGRGRNSHNGTDAPPPSHGSAVPPWLADGNVQRPTARHNMRMDSASSAPSTHGRGDPSAAPAITTPTCANRVFSAHLITALHNAFPNTLVLFGTSLLWRQHLSAIQWQLIAYTSRLKEAAKLGSATMLQTSSRQGGGAANTPLTSAEARAFVDDPNNSVVMCGRSYNPLQCFAILLALNPTEVVMNTMYGMFKRYWRLMGSYLLAAPPPTQQQQQEGSGDLLQVVMADPVGNATSDNGTTKRTLSLIGTTVLPNVAAVDASVNTRAEQHEGDTIALSLWDVAACFCYYCFTFSAIIMKHHQEQEEQQQMGGGFAGHDMHGGYNNVVAMPDAHTLAAEWAKGASSVRAMVGISSSACSSNTPAGSRKKATVHANDDDGATTAVMLATLSEKAQRRLPANYHTSITSVVVGTTSTTTPTREEEEDAVSTSSSEQQSMMPVRRHQWSAPAPYPLPLTMFSPLATLSPLTAKAGGGSSGCEGPPSSHSTRNTTTTTSAASLAGWQVGTNDDVALFMEDCVKVLQVMSA